MQGIYATIISFNFSAANGNHVRTYLQMSYLIDVPTHP